MTEHHDRLIRAELLGQPLHPLLCAAQRKVLHLVGEGGECQFGLLPDIDELGWWVLLQKDVQIGCREGPGEAVAGGVRHGWILKPTWHRPRNGQRCRQVT